MRPFWLNSFVSAFLCLDAVATVTGLTTQAVLGFSDSRGTWNRNDQLPDLETSHPVALNPAPNRQLRITATDSQLCDPNVKQYSGYLDVSSSKHIFFWFFESRRSPSTSPLIIWLNGGPGCSSMTGLFFELGPCSLQDEGKSTRLNRYSWNEHANILFIDQPVGVGFSYFDDDWEHQTTKNVNKTVPIDNSKDAGQDFYALLQLFFDRYPEYAHAPLHLAAESYGGVYAPNFASIIHHENKKLANSHLNQALERRHINLASIILANAMSNPLIQMAAVPEYVCGGGPFPVYTDPNGKECRKLRSLTKTCLGLIKSCYEHGNKTTCREASIKCFAILDDVTGVNPYDVRLPCDNPEDQCYKELGWIPTWMNNVENRLALGVPLNANVSFAPCSEDVHLAFEESGDGMHNSASLLTELVNDGVRLLVFAGNADMLANIIGTERWVTHLDSVFHEVFSWKMNNPWNIEGSDRPVGEVRSAGPGAGNLTYVKVYDAGHMAPHDQPEAMLDLVVRWMNNEPLDI